MSDVMRGAWCVIRMIVVGAALSACSNLVALPTTQPGSTPSVAVSQAPTPLSGQAALNPTNIDCSGDAEPPVVASGWKLLWQKVFEYPIARPPVVDGGQALLIERADARWTSLQDSVALVDAQTGKVQWDSIEAKDPIPHVSRYVLGIQYSPKYWLLLLRYMKPEGSRNPPSMQYEIVVDRQSGQVIYDSGPNAGGSEWLLALSDEALFDNYNHGSSMWESDSIRRVDLPAGTTRWQAQWNSRFSRGWYLAEGWVYVFTDAISKYSQSDGKLSASTNFDLFPAPGDVALEGNLAVMRSDSMQPEERGIGVFDLQTFSGMWHTQTDYRPGRDSNAFWGDIPSLSVTADSIYMFDAQNTLSRFDLHSGKLLWQAPSPGPKAMSRPIAMSGMVFGLFADGTVRAFTEADGAPAGVVGQFPVWYWTSTDTREWLDLVGGLGASGNTLIVTTGCRSVYAIQRAP